MRRADGGATEAVVAELAPIVEFTVRGSPVPQGSHRAFQPTKKLPDGRRIPVGHPVVVPDNPANLQAWRNAVHEAAAAAMGEREILRGPVGLIVTFVMQRPQGHFSKKGFGSDLLRSAPAYPTVRPDLDKLERAVKDALKGVVYNDDSQVVTKASRKVYGEQPGVRVGVTHPADELLAFDWST
jgi:crossover junction endodeoxyribonuclease RusA